MLDCAELVGLLVLGYVYAAEAPFPDGLSCKLEIFIYVVELRSDDVLLLQGSGSVSSFWVFLDLDLHDIIIF